MEKGVGIKTVETKKNAPLSAARPVSERLVHRLTVKLIDTYAQVNQSYYDAKALRLKEQRGGVHNEGFDDQNYDYILIVDEVFADRYTIKHRIGKVTNIIHVSV